MKKDKMTLEECLAHFLDAGDSTNTLTVSVKSENVEVDFDGSVPFLLFNALTTALQNGYTMAQVKEILDMASKFAKSKK